MKNYKKTKVLKEVARDFKIPLKPTQQSTEKDISEVLDLIATEEVYIGK
jgi:hypothetical protein